MDYSSLFSWFSPCALFETEDLCSTSRITSNTAAASSYGLLAFAAGYPVIRTGVDFRAEQPLNQRSHPRTAFARELTVDQATVPGRSYCFQQECLARILQIPSSSSIIRREQGEIPAFRASVVTDTSAS